MKPLMYKVIFVICMGAFTTGTTAQIGIRLGQSWVSHDVWDGEISSLSNDLHFSYNREIGIDYWFRLKNYRVEFMPSINYAWSNKAAVTGVEASVNNHNYNQLSTRANVHIYFVDFFEDCDCPVWSKENDFIKKGIFITVSPQIGLRRHSELFLNSNNQTNYSSDVFWGIAIGVGLDIGFSNLITVTPIYKLGYRSSTQWDNLIENSSPVDNTFYHGIELRLGLRVDH